MSWFRRADQRQRVMEWGSSFAQADAAAEPRRWWQRTPSAYDAPMMANHHPADEPRSIGTRALDVPVAIGEDKGASRPPRRGLLRRLSSLILLLAALLLVVGLGGLVWLGLKGGGSPDVTPGTIVTVRIPDGATSERISHILAQQGVVERETVFRARLKLNGDGADFRSGSYSMKTGSSYDTIVRTLEKGPTAAPTFDLTLPEGMRVEETAAHIDSIRDAAQREGGKVLPAFTGAEYLKAVKAQTLPTDAGAPKGTTSMEGYLFPATYQLVLSATAVDFVAKQREAFEQNMAEIDMAAAKKANLTQYDIVTIASLIEREARLAKERPLVAAVIWNRLKIGEPLGIDASNQYSVYEAGSDEFWVRELRQSHLDKESPYNLRKVAGLPPTPIAAPSRASLDAAAAPADVKFRYYVANPDGSGEHFFTESYDAFLAHPFQNG